MLKKLFMVAAMSAVTASAFAVGQAQVQKSIELKDGSTVYIFNDGKMAMESRFGGAVSMEPGHVMETKDGKTIVMKGNEIWRLNDSLPPGENWNSGG